MHLHEASDPTIDCNAYSVSAAEMAAMQLSSHLRISMSVCGNIHHRSNSERKAASSPPANQF